MTPLPDLSDYSAVLFDLDGVLTPTADVHRRAWSALFTGYFRAQGVAEYLEQDYFDYLDGKPRYEGVESVLESRGLSLPWGAPSDPAGEDTVCALGNRKNDVFAQVLVDEGVTPYPGSVALLDLLEEAGVPGAVVSSSRNARAVLGAAKLGERFEVVIDGTVAEAEGIAGKPEPDTFLSAASILGASIEESAVVEDAISGVAAGRAGNFGLVVAVDRGVGHEALVEAGADVVVDDLQELADVIRLGSEAPAASEPGAE